MSTIAWLGMPAVARAAPNSSTYFFSFWAALYCPSGSLANSPGSASLVNVRISLLPPRLRVLEREASAYQEFHPATFVAMPRNCDGEPAALYALASSSAPGFRLSFQPSQPPWPASRYWTTLGRLSVSNAYATPSLYPAALSWQVVRSMLVTRLGSESGSMRRAKAVLGFALRIVAIARDRIRRDKFLQ